MKTEPLNAPYGVMVEWNKEKLHRFKVAYNWAVAQHNKEFVWDGYEFVTDYAKYLIQYLETQLGTVPIKTKP